MVNWGAAVQVIVPIIGVSGVIIPIFLTPLINQTYNKPDLEINIPEKKENEAFSILKDAWLSSYHYYQCRHSFDSKYEQQLPSNLTTGLSYNR